MEGLTMTNKTAIAAAVRAAMGTTVGHTPDLDAYTERVKPFVDGDRARNILQRFRTDAELIRASEQLSAKGREVEIAKRYVEATKELDALRTEFHTNMDAHRTQLLRGMFGPLDTSHEAIMSSRTAHTLASQLDNKDDALRELEWAQLVGDETYARAITHHATTQYGDGWSEVVDSYAKHHPSVPDTLDEIRNLPDNSALEDLLFEPREPHEFEGKGDPLDYAKRVVQTAEEPLTDISHAFDTATAPEGDTNDGME